MTLPGSHPLGLLCRQDMPMFAQAQTARYGLTEEQLAKVRVKNSFYGAQNPKATYQKALTPEEVLESEVVASPLKNFDCCANADGASCTILAAGDIAKRASDTPIWIMGIGSRSDTQMTGRTSLTSLRAAKIAAEQAYRMAGVSADDVLGLAQLDDGIKVLALLSKSIPQTDIKVGMKVRIVPVELMPDRVSYELQKIESDDYGTIINPGRALNGELRRN